MERDNSLYGQTALGFGQEGTFWLDLPMRLWTLSFADRSHQLPFSREAHCDVVDLYTPVPANSELGVHLNESNDSVC